MRREQSTFRKKVVESFFICFFFGWTSNNPPQDFYGRTLLSTLSRITRLATLPPCCRATAPMMANTAPAMTGSRPEPTWFSGWWEGAGWGECRLASRSETWWTCFEERWDRNKNRGIRGGRGQPGKGGGAAHHFRPPPHDFGETGIHGDLGELGEGEEVVGLVGGEVVEAPELGVLEGLAPVGEDVARGFGEVGGRGDDGLRGFHDAYLAACLMLVTRSLILHFQHASTKENIPRKARRSLKPLRPWSKLLWVTASHFSSSGSRRSPSRPRNLVRAASSFLGSLLTSQWRRAGFLVMCGEKGAIMRSGV